jgi:hypothetical protein
VEEVVKVSEMMGTEGKTWRISWSKDHVAIPPRRAAIGAALLTESEKTPSSHGLDGAQERAVGCHKTVRHAGCIKGEAGRATFVEEDQPTGSFAAIGEQLDGGLCSASGGGGRGAKKIRGGLGHYDFHDCFTKSCGGDASGLGVRVAATADERRIANPTGVFAAGPAGGSGGEETASFIQCDGADSALLVPTMMLGCMGILAAPKPGVVFCGRDEFFRITKGNPLFGGEALGAIGDEHHVRRFFEHCASSENRIFDATEASDGTSAESCSIHYDGVAFDVAIEIEMRAETGIEDGVIFEDDDGGLDGVERVATTGEHSPTGAKGAKTTSLAGVGNIIRDVPSTAVENEGGSHGG